MEFVKGVESRYGFEETVERLKDASGRRGWRVVNTLDMSESGVVIVEICKGELAKEVLKEEANCWVSAMMPCRLAVCKRSDGVFVYTMNMETFANMIGGKIGEILSGVAEEEREILSSINS